MSNSSPPSEHNQGDQIDARGAQGYINRPSGPVTQYFGDVIYIFSFTWFKRLPLLLKLILFSIGVLVLGALVYWILSVLDLVPESPQAMPPREWNVAVAGIGTLDDAKIARESEQGQALSNQIYGLLAPHSSNIRGWNAHGVGTITGDKEARYEQAMAIAERMKASIVVYGFIEPTRPGWATFTPEFYVADTGTLPAFSLGLEVTGPQQFGAPIEYTVDVSDNRRMQDALAPRLAALRHVVTGLQLYAAEDFTYAREEFCLALQPQPEGESEAALCPEITLPSECRALVAPETHKAVIHLFLGALEHAQHNYHEAMHHAAAAHCIWPEYPRPFLTKAAVLYTLALEQHEREQSRLTVPADTPDALEADVTCAELNTIPSLTTSDYLHLALRCYDEALAAEEKLLISDSESSPDLVSSMDMHPKVALSRGGVYFLLADRGEPKYWDNARAAFAQVIESYAIAVDGPNAGEEQTIARRTRRADRLRRLAAHAHARLGAIILCEPNCETPARKEHRHDQEDAEPPANAYAQAAEHYAQALALLQFTAECKQDVEKCVESDIPFIRTYQCQLAEIYRFLERSIPDGWQCNQTIL